MILGINWLDIVFFAILIGMVFKGSHAGIGSQIVSLIWLFLLIFVSIGFYSNLASGVFGFIVATWARALSFLLISVILILVIKILERIFSVDQSEGLSPIERLGGAVIAALRAVIIFGLVSTQLMLLPVPAIYDSVRKTSSTAKYCIELDATIYSWISFHMDFLKDEKVDIVLDELEESSGF